MKKQYFVRAEWDDEAKCWYVSDTNVPGLAADAETIPQLTQKLLSMVSDLLIENSRSKKPIKFQLETSQKTELLACA